MAAVGGGAEAPAPAVQLELLVLAPGGGEGGGGEAQRVALRLYALCEDEDTQGLVSRGRRPRAADGRMGHQGSGAERQRGSSAQ